MPENFQMKHSTAVACNNRGTDSQTTGFMPSYSYYVLACNGIGQICRAYSRGNNYVIAFILFLYLAFLCLELCCRAYQRLPPHEESQEKDVLKTAIWLLTTAIIFTIVSLFAPYFYWTANLITFSVATAGSACIFYVYFVYDDSNKNCSCCSSNEKIKASHYSRRIGRGTDKEVKQSITTLDIV